MISAKSDKMCTKSDHLIPAVFNIIDVERGFLFYFWNHCECLRLNASNIKTDTIVASWPCSHPAFMKSCECSY